MLADPAFLPDLIILDLNIRRISGRELLGHRKLRDVPVVVFSSLWNEADARRALKLGAREYAQQTHGYRRLHPCGLGNDREVGYAKQQ